MTIKTSPMTAVSVASNTAVSRPQGEEEGRRDLPAASERKVTPRAHRLRARGGP